MKQLNETLDTLGYAVVNVMSFEGFQKSCQSLGSISQTIEVRVMPDGRQYPHRADEVPFHTDHPMVPYVGWFCIEQDDQGGENMLVDSRQAITLLSEHAKQILTEVKLRMFHREGSHPLLQVDPHQIYWLPVIINEERQKGNTAHIHAIMEFQAAIRNTVDAGRAVSIRLRPGEALFVDNRRMLHGRKSIAQESRRFLIRAYIVK